MPGPARILRNPRFVTQATPGAQPACHLRDESAAMAPADGNDRSLVAVARALFDRAHLHAFGVVVVDRLGAFAHQAQVQRD